MEKSSHPTEADYVIVGSGAAGATAALALSQAGHSVLVLEEGSRLGRANYSEDLYGAIARSFRDWGMQVATGRSVIPVLQGRCVGGTTVMNGAIIHRLPEAVYDRWVEQDKALGQALKYEALERHSDEIEKQLSIRANLAPTLPSLPIKQHFERLGWQHQPMRRNAPDCQFTGRCLQGCPSGGKLSMERSFLPWAEEEGAVVVPNFRVEQILFKPNAQAYGVKGKRGKQDSVIRAKKGVIVAAGVVHTPQILSRSGLKLPALGKHFQCHLSLGVGGLLSTLVDEITGPPQGIEVTQFQDQGVKLATQLLPPELILARTPFLGTELAHYLKKAPYFSNWMASVGSSAEGCLRPRRYRSAKIEFDPTTADLEKIRFATKMLATLLFEMGAKVVYPSLSTTDPRASRLHSMEDLTYLDKVPLNPKHYVMSMGHLFGTCRIGSDSKNNVVDPHFQVHGTRQLYVLDASVFPSHLGGLNPQHSIMAVARAGCDAILSNFQH